MTIREVVARVRFMTKQVRAIEEVRNVFGSLERFLLDRERLLDMRTRLVDKLHWQLHDMWPEWEIPAKALTQPGWQTKVASRLARAEQAVQIMVARDVICRPRELSRATIDLYEKIAALVKTVAPPLLAEPEIG
ncbi:MAG: hypothetical protein M3Y09_11330 [Actinomycetota bacterium]|nr:hypothetical protein [Actinomycetota bacterium]